MSKAFDPTPYIEAERAKRAAVAAACDAGSYIIAHQKTAKICHLQQQSRSETGRVADVSGVAAPPIGAFPWSTDLARFLMMGCPIGRSPARWSELLADCDRFSREWGHTAVSLGWSISDTFGSPINPYSSATDQLGLVPLLRGRTIAAMTDTSATIVNKRGSANTFRLYPWRRPGVPLWIAYSLGGGP